MMLKGLNNNFFFGTDLHTRGVSMMSEPATISLREVLGRLFKITSVIFRNTAD